MRIRKPSLDVNASLIGNFARSHLAAGGKGRVMGCTSRGIFCLTASARIGFVTTENLPGPLILIVDSLPEMDKSSWTGIEFKQTAGSLAFPRLNLKINHAQAQQWQPPPKPSAAATDAQRRERVKSLAAAILASYRESIFLPLIKWLLNPGYSAQTAFISTFEITQLRQSLREAVHLNDPRRAAIILNRFLGLGLGLTPSGDDFIAGFLFTLARWQPVVCPHFNLELFGFLLLAAAGRRTSYLSASLIECAALGWADASLLAVLDRLFGSRFDPQAAAESLLAYGSSSGLDAFAGMALALQMNNYE
jgi:hypothetical protein